VSRGTVRVDAYILRLQSSRKYEEETASHQQKRLEESIHASENLLVKILEIIDKAAFL
jgi:hypothetical protein